MATETQIANLALGHLGAARIADLSENSVAAEHCRRMWDTTRDALLRQHHWNFAGKRVVLTPLLAVPAFGWAKEYPLPSECMRVLTVNGRAAGTAGSDFEVEGRSILTNAERCQVTYVGRVTACSVWDAAFTELFSYELAAAMAPSFTLQTSVVTALKQQAELARSRSMESDAVETKPRVVRSGARGGSWHEAECSPAGGAGSGVPVSVFAQLEQLEAAAEALQISVGALQAAVSALQAGGGGGGGGTVISVTNGTASFTASGQTFSFIVTGPS